MNKWIIAEGNQTVVLVDNGNQVGILVFADDLEQAQVNARLIAAAPDLLDACNEFADIFPEFSMSELDAADFKDRAHRIWAAAQTAKIAITKTEPQQADEPERTG